jgi:hypothetical protein
MNHFDRIKEEEIDPIFDLYGTSPFQSPKAMHARSVSLPPGDFAVFQFHLPNERIIFSAFERMHNRLWRCFFLSDPFLSSSPMNDAERLDCLESMRDQLDAEGLYFPYVDHRSDCFSFFSSRLDCLSLQRLPSPMIHWRLNDQTFIERIGNHSKKRAHRFWKKFENRLQLQSLTGEEAVCALDAIERRSWKYVGGQSMHHRDCQFAFYGGWLGSGGLFLHTATDCGKPVAYRLDAKIGRTVYAIKYSYDEEYKQCSPGYYLLTKGLEARWSADSIEMIDLWGSPDLLKNSIKSGEYQRYDFFWPSCTAGQKVLDDKRSHDQRLDDSVNDSLGLKSVYL